MSQASNFYRALFRAEHLTFTVWIVRRQRKIKNCNKKITENFRKNRTGPDAAAHAWRPWCGVVPGTDDPRREVGVFRSLGTRRSPAASSGQSRFPFRSADCSSACDWIENKRQEVAMLNWNEPEAREQRQLIEQKEQRMFSCYEVTVLRRVATPVIFEIKFKWMKEWLRFRNNCLIQRSSTGVHVALQGAPKYAWGAPLKKGSQRCITNLSH